MKITSFFIAAMFSLFVLPVYAQTDAPKGFKSGSIVLADGSGHTGLVKDNIRNNTSVVFIAEGKDKKTYSGAELTSAEIEGVKFICINGDFFKILCEGQLCFLQKSSDASGKPVYNGTEATFSSGTDGKINDYFIYNGKDRQLRLVSKKNVDEVAASCFAGHTAAIEKAKTINGDLSQIKEAVQIYNNESK